MLAAEVAVYQAFPGGGPFPYPAADLIGITAFALVGLVLARGSQLTRPLGGLFLAYLVDRLVREALPVAARRQRDARARLRDRAACSRS